MKRRKSFLERHKFKGVLLPSWRDSKSGTVKHKKGSPALPPDSQWKAHTGTRAQMRNMKHICRPILMSKSDVDIQTLARVRAATANEPMPEFGFLHLVMSGLAAFVDTGEPWAVCMNYMLDKWERAAHGETTNDAVVGHENTDVPSAVHV